MSKMLGRDGHPRSSACRVSCKLVNSQSSPVQVSQTLSGWVREGRVGSHVTGGQRGSLQLQMQAVDSKGSLRCYRDTGQGCAVLVCVCLVRDALT